MHTRGLVSPGTRGLRRVRTPFTAGGNAAADGLRCAFGALTRPPPGCCSPAALGSACWRTSIGPVRQPRRGAVGVGEARGTWLDLPPGRPTQEAARYLLVRLIRWLACPSASTGALKGADLELKTPWPRSPPRGVAQTPADVWAGAGSRVGCLRRVARYPTGVGERVARVEVACRVSAAGGPIRDKRSDACGPGEGVAVARVDRASRSKRLGWYERVGCLRRVAGYPTGVREWVARVEGACRGFAAGGPIPDKR